MIPFQRINPCLRLLFSLFVLLPSLGWATEEPIQALATAIEKGELVQVEKLLNDGVDPNQRITGSSLQYTPLFLAVNGNHSAITRALLKAGADPKIEDENGDPVMTMAAAHPEHLAEAKLLIESGISIDFKNRAGITALLRVASYAKADEIQTIINLGADPNLADPEGNTPLMIAIANDKLGTVEILLKAGAKVDLRNKAGKSALQLVFDPEGYHVETEATPGIVKLLVKNGADINQRDSEGRTILLRALDSLYPKPLGIQIILDSKPDLAPRNQDGRDALFLTVRKDDPKIPAQKLIDLGADIKTVDHDNVDLLMLAAGNSNPDQVRFFLDQGLSPKSRSKQGSSAVHYAALCGRWENSDAIREATASRTLEILKLLESLGGSLTAADIDGDTPLHLAALTGSPLVVSYLLPHFPAAALPNNAGDTPLHLASASGADDVIDLLIPKYKDVDPRNHEGRTPLMEASTNGNEEIIVRLLKAGAEINAADSNGVTSFTAATKRYDFNHMRFLMKQGADLKSLPDPDAELLRAARQVHSNAMQIDDYVFIVELFSGLAKNINALDADKMTTLMWIAASNRQTVLKAFLSRHPDLDARSPDGRTAMMWAAVSGAEESIKTLREAGANDNLRDKTDRTADEWLAWSRNTKTLAENRLQEGTAPLRERIASSRQIALERYLDQGTWNPDDRMAGSSPLHLAAALGDTGAIETLIKQGAPANQSIEDHSTPLMEAAANGQLKTVRFLLARGADPALRNDSRQRAIDLAVKFRHVEIARLLLHLKNALSSEETDLLVTLIGGGDKSLLRDFLQAGASIAPKGKRMNDSMDRRETQSDAPLQAAALQPTPDILKILVEFPSQSGADDADYLTTALHLAADRGRLANVTYLIEDLKVNPNSLKDESFGGVTRIDSTDPDKQGPIEGFSPLSLALENGHADVVRYLVQHGAIITGRTRSGSPPLTYVIEHRQLELLKFFLENNAPTGFVDYAGKTALHIAAESNDVAAVRLLLDHGADPAAKTTKGMTPLDLAKEKKNAETSRLLEGFAK